MNAVAMILKPVDRGWVVALTDGRELARFTGFAAKWRAVRYISGGQGFSRGGTPPERPWSRMPRGLRSWIPPEP